MYQEAKPGCILYCSHKTNDWISLPQFSPSMSWKKILISFRTPTTATMKLLKHKRARSEDTSLLVLQGVYSNRMGNGQICWQKTEVSWGRKLLWSTQDEVALCVHRVLVCNTNTKPLILLIRLGNKQINNWKYESNYFVGLILTFAFTGTLLFPNLYIVLKNLVLHYVCYLHYCYCKLDVWDIE